MTRMPHLRAWRRLLATSRGEQQSRALMSKAARRYHHLLAERPLLESRALRPSLRRRILPGLALYLTLCQEFGDQEAVLAEMEFVFRRSLFVQQAAGIRLLSYLPDLSKV